MCSDKQILGTFYFRPSALFLSYRLTQRKLLAKVPSSVRSQLWPLPPETFSTLADLHRARKGSSNLYSDICTVMDGGTHPLRVTGCASCVYCIVHGLTVPLKKLFNSRMAARRVASYARTRNSCCTALLLLRLLHVCMTCRMFTLFRRGVVNETGYETNWIPVGRKLYNLLKKFFYETFVFVTNRGFETWYYWGCCVKNCPFGWSSCF